MEGICYGYGRGLRISRLEVQSGWIPDYILMSVMTDV